MAYLLFSKKGKVCVRIERDESKNIIFKPGFIKRSFNSLLYFTKCAVPASILLFFKKTTKAQEFTPNKEPESIIFDGQYDKEILYGDVRIRDPIGELLVYIEGSFGALLMVIFFLLFLTSFILSFFQKDKLKKRRKKIWGLVFLFLSLLAFLIRSLVSVFLGHEYI